ncbi:peptide MFS transporter [Aquimonas voraii]|uniref:Proton-dependent oligopeptide transporter, POT family n=1 Tax=Aquimonas voraii TaxID=265719 RepID=A0A1G6UDQ0_9GAMM|nr:peptide MFS transporter [Aquimonas voraii]SDD39371.1 proton-dependent oligopeptide transporter, POT family [Aquimonas voraii]
MSQAIQPANSGELFGHPKGLYVCFLTEMWERFAFYGMKALLFLYLTKHHLFTDSNGYLLLGTYAGLAYALPLLGGILADRYLGMRKAVVFGGVLLVLGQLGMAYTGSQAGGSVGAAQQDLLAIQVMYASLALIAVGVGFLKPNISTIVGRLYADTDPRRESGFTIFYMGINVGAALSSIVVAWIGETIGWGYGFALAGVMMGVGLVQFVLGQKHLLGRAEPADPAFLRAPALAGLSREWLIYLAGLVTVVVVWQVLQTRLDFSWLGAVFEGHEVTLTEVVAVVMGAGLFVWFGFFLFSGVTAVERGRMIVLMVLIVISALFWGLYEQSYGPWVAFAERVMDRSFLGMEWTAGQTTAIGAICVIAFSPVFAWLWPRLDKAGLNPSLPAKFGWALVLVGAAMGVLQWSTAAAEGGALVGMGWLIAAYAVMVAGEMLLSPIGLSAVTTLSVPRVVGMMMGAWFLFSAFGEMIAGRFGTWASIAPEADGSFDVAKALTTYGEFFGQMMWIGVAAGVFMLLLSPLLNRLTRPR